MTKVEQIRLLLCKKIEKNVAFIYLKRLSVILLLEWFRAVDKDYH